jgi:hypothetical protein
MTVVVVLLFVEAIPIGALVSAVFDRDLRRRSRFWLRFAGIVIAIVLPGLVALAVPVREQTVAMLIGLGWGILLLVPSWFVLFQGWGLDPGSADDGDGPGPEDARPTPPSPIGGIPLPDAEPSSARVRDHRPTTWPVPPRRPVRERDRSVARTTGNGRGDRQLREQVPPLLCPRTRRPDRRNSPSGSTARRPERPR